MASSVLITFLTLLLAHNIYASSSSSKPLLLPLSHSLSTSQFNSTHHLLKSTSATSAARFRHHKQRHRRHVSLPLSPGTDYTLSFSLSSQTISLYMDTGSDVVWLPCSPFSCMLCEGKSPSTISNHKPLNISSAAAASKVTCKSRACAAVHSHLPSSDICAMAKCPLEEIEISDCAAFSCPSFYYAYGDGSFVAKLYSDTLNIPMSNPSLNLYNFTFGCAHAALGEPIGVAGFGRGILSLPAQLATSNPHLGNQFSYCLISHSFDSVRVRRPSPLILGRYSSDNKNKRVKKSEEELVEFAYTPLLENPTHPYFYLVGLQAISVGNRRFPAPASLTTVDKKGNGGMVVDSGTTYTMLPVEMYKLVVTEFSRRVEVFYKRASHVEDRTGLGPCYYVDSVRKVPQLIFHFVGNSSSVVMPRRNYFYQFLDGGDDGKSRRKVGCVMLMNGGDFPESDGPAGLLGNYQQQGFEVMYDLENKRVGFAERKCASLWDTLG